MSDTNNLSQPQLLTDLPLDALLEIFDLCDLEDVLNLSAVRIQSQCSGLFLVPNRIAGLQEAKPSVRRGSDSVESNKATPGSHP